MYLILIAYFSGVYFIYKMFISNTNLRMCHRDAGDNEIELRARNLSSAIVSHILQIT